MRISAPGLVQLVTAISAGDIRACSDLIPNDAAIAGIRWDDETRTLEIDLFHHDWPIDRDDTIDFLYVRRLTDGFTPDAWGMAVALDPPDPTPTNRLTKRGAQP